MPLIWRREPNLKFVGSHQQQQQRQLRRSRTLSTFIGHDGMFEVPFFVETVALARPGRTEKCPKRICLTAFDASARLHARCRTRSLFSWAPHVLYFDRGRFPLGGDSGC